ncbi:MAG: hypothetical protein F4092_00925, partial [Rhodospirillaceae bacterium]|nr:hypothetical protein [Rhodospirillaceae bacterium]MYJ70336.1 hypothetical protein [Rhodospirillaceae bacterium]
MKRCPRRSRRKSEPRWPDGEAQPSRKKPAGKKRTPAGAGRGRTMSKEKFERTKPHVNVGT